MKYSFLPVLLLTLCACRPQTNTAAKPEPAALPASTDTAHIAQYVTSVYEDSKGHLWFGSIGSGIARYDGTTLTYLTQADGLPTNRVTSVIEDKNGTYWFSTDEGLVKLVGDTFTQLKIAEGNIFSNMVGPLTYSPEGQLLVGTWNGVYRFDGDSFIPFPVPYPTVSTKINPDTKGWVTALRYDAAGHLWIARDGHGITKYDGDTFVHYTMAEGLNSNNVTEVEIDNAGQMWFGMRNGGKDHSMLEEMTAKGGVNQLVDGKFISFTEVAGLLTDDVYALYKDRQGHIWISTTRNGVYAYDGAVFTPYAVPISIMDMHQDRAGNMWLAGAGGLYRIGAEGEIVSVRRGGPWE